GVPLVDQARSYRSIAARIAAEIPARATCVVRRNVGDAQRALLDYFAAIRTVPEDAAAADRCEVMLAQSSPGRRAAPEAGWEESWRGARPGDRNEMFVLYRRAARASTTSTQ